MAQAAIGILSPVKEPQRTYMWEVVFQDDFNTKNIKAVQHYAMTSGIPTITQEVITRRYMGAKYFYIGRESSGKTIRMTFWDNQDMEMYEFFNDWINTGQAGHYGELKANPRECFKTIFLKMKDTSDILNKRTFVLTKCYPTEISQVTLNYSESSSIMIDVTFQYHAQYFQEKPSFVKQLDLSLSNIAGAASTVLGR